MSSPRKVALSSASTKNTALPNVSMWQSSEPKGLKTYTFGDQVHPSWMEQSSPEMTRPESTSLGPVHNLSERLLLGRVNKPRILIRGDHDSQKLFLKRGFRTERTGDDEQSSSIFGDRINASTSMHEEANPYFLPKVKADRILTHNVPRLSFGRPFPDLEPSSPLRTDGAEDLALQTRDSLAVKSTPKHRSTVSGTLPEDSKLISVQVGNTLSVRDNLRHQDSHVSLDNQKLKNLKSASSLQEETSNQGSFSMKPEKNGGVREKPSKIFSHLGRMRSETGLFEEKMGYKFKKAEETRLKQMKEMLLKQKYGNNMADFKKDIEAVFTDLANPTSSKRYGKNLEQVEPASNRLSRPNRSVPLSHRLKLLPGMNPLELSKERTIDPRPPNILVGILSQSTKTKPVDGFGSSQEATLNLPEMGSPSIMDGQTSQAAQPSPMLPPTPFLKAFSQLANQAISKIRPPPIMIQPRQPSLTNRTSLSPLNKPRPSESPSKRKQSERDRQPKGSRDKGTILSTTEFGERSSRGKKSSAFVKKSRGRNKEASRVGREDSHYSHTSQLRPSQMFKRKMRSEKEDLEMIVSDIKYQLGLLIKLEGIPDKYELLRMITGDNPACEILEIYLEAPEQLERFPMSILQLDPERPKNMRLIIGDLKEYFLNSKQKVLEKETAELRVYNELTDLSRVRLKQKFIQQSFLRPDLDSNPRLQDLKRICDQDFLQMLDTTRVAAISDKLEILEEDNQLDYLSDYSREISKLTLRVTSKMFTSIGHQERNPELNPLGLGNGMLKRLREVPLDPKGCKIDIPPLLDMATIGIPEFPERTNSPVGGKEYSVEL